MPNRFSQTTTKRGRLRRTALAMTLLVTAFAVPALSGDTNTGYRRPAQPPVETNGGVGLPSYLPGVGTYAGGLSATRFRGNGNYFYWQGDGSYVMLPPPVAARKPKQGAKIIVVGKDETEMDCDDASGVCIIRP